MNAICCFQSYPFPKNKIRCYFPPVKSSLSNASCGLIALTRIILTYSGFLSFLVRLPAPNVVGVHSACQVNESIFLASWERLKHRWHQVWAMSSSKGKGKDSHYCTEIPAKQRNNTSTWMPLLYPLTRLFVGFSLKILNYKMTSTLGQKTRYSLGNTVRPPSLKNKECISWLLKEPSLRRALGTM
jgi:hypothetical protein